jgi:hypothetical protein
MEAAQLPVRLRHLAGRSAFFVPQIHQQHRQRRSGQHSQPVDAGASP